uniref:Acyl_transf_3 domain-containing protein n=1 Tax=Heterorhabditis bacteriophora TaxID=37862 RepID=A0A1I7WPK0_HETBA
MYELDPAMKRFIFKHYFANTTMGLRAVFHLVTFLTYTYICYFDYNLVKGSMLPIPDQFFSKFVWLTLICLYIQTFYHLIAFFIDLTRCQHAFFHYFARAIVGPIGMSVVLLFWTLFLFDPNTLLADENAKRIIAIKWYNHGIHTLPLITVLIDISIWNHGQPSKKAAVIGIAVFAVLYITELVHPIFCLRIKICYFLEYIFAYSLHYVYYISGFWAYPILGQLSLPFRTLFIAALTTIYSVVALVAAICHANSRLKSFLDFVLYTILFPIGMTACTLFWCLHAVDPSLIMPDWVAALIPSWLNHVTHTLPVPYFMMDMLMTKRLVPTQKTTFFMSVFLRFICADRGWLLGVPPLFFTIY